jgi:hypothetical protein
MELEGLGVSLVGHTIWSYGEAGKGLIPWEFIQSVNYSMRMLIHGYGSKGASFAEIEKDWSCVWNPSSAKDWSCIATLIRSVGNGGSCLIVFDHCDGIPHTFWSFIDNVLREGRISLTRVWIHTQVPMWIPDALFFPPILPEQSAIALQILQAIPARNGHSHWRANDDWENIVRATKEQELGVVVTDVQENDWALMWWRPSDSRTHSNILIPRALQWISLATDLMKNTIT